MRPCRRAWVELSIQQWPSLPPWTSSLAGRRRTTSCAREHRGRAGAAGRAALRQRRLRAAERRAAGAALLRAVPRAPVRGHRSRTSAAASWPIPTLLAEQFQRDAGVRRAGRHALSGRPRRPRAAGGPRRRLRPGHLRPGAAPRADPHRRRHRRERRRSATPRSPPATRSRPPSSSSTAWPRPAARRAACVGFDVALAHGHRDGGGGLQPRRRPVGPLHRHHRPRRQAGRPAPVGPDHPGRAPLDGEVVAGRQHRLQRRAPLRLGAAAGRRAARPSTAASWPSSRWRCRPPRWPCASWPRSAACRRTRSARARSAPASSARSATPPPRSRKRRSSSTTPAASRSSKLVARARRLKRSIGLDLIVIDYVQLITAGPGLAAREPGAGAQPDHPGAEVAGQGAAGAGDRRGPALAPGREPRGQAPAAARTCANPARSSRTPTW